eukprot:3940125-Heterocapsa_arctica.AAC.1
MKELGWVDNTPPQTSLTTKVSPESSVNSLVLLEMALIEPDNWLGKRLEKADTITKELKKEWMSSPPGSYITTWHKNNI